MLCFLWLPFLGLIFLSQEQASVPRDKSGAGFFFFFLIARRKMELKYFMMMNLVWEEKVSGIQTHQ